MQLSPVLCDFWVSHSMRAVYLLYAQEVRNMFKGKQNAVVHFSTFVSRLFQILFVPFSLLFVAKKQNT